MSTAFWRRLTSTSAEWRRECLRKIDQVYAAAIHLLCIQHFHAQSRMVVQADAVGVTRAACLRPGKSHPVRTGRAIFHYSGNAVGRRKPKLSRLWRPVGSEPDAAARAGN